MMKNIFICVYVLLFLTSAWLKVYYLSALPKLKRSLVGISFKDYCVAFRLKG